MNTSSGSDRDDFPVVDMPITRGCPFNPPEELGRLREESPLARLRFPDGHEGWLITNHEMGRAVIGDQRFSAYPGGVPHMQSTRAVILYDALRQQESIPQEIHEVVEEYREAGRLVDAFRDPRVISTLHTTPLRNLPWVIQMDPPEHARLRRILTGFFSVKKVEQHRASVERIVAERLEVLARTGAPADLIEVVAQPLPSLMTCELYGVPAEDKETFERLAHILDSPDSSTEDILNANAEFREFARALIREKQRHPGDDLISALAQHEELSVEELVTISVALVRASHPTTMTALAASVATLLADRVRWNAVVARTAPISRVVEELLRFTAIAPTSDTRTALEDVEIGGTTIKAFDSVVVSQTAANRDPRVFENPDDVDLDRRPGPHLTFGFGIHQCLGQNLARLELQVAIGQLAERFPTLDLAVPVEEIAWLDGDRILYGPERLPVTW